MEQVGRIFGIFSRLVDDVFGFVSADSSMFE